MNCTDLQSRSTLFNTLQHTSISGIANLVATCPQVCQLSYGTGDTDLDGPGALVSFVIFFSIALLFCFPIIIDSVLIPAFWRGKEEYKPTWFTVWLQELHNSCLWTAVFYTLALSIAAFLQYMAHQTSGIYENAAIIHAILVSFGCQQLIIVAYYDKFKKPIFFGVVMVITIAFGIYPTFMPAFGTSKWISVLLDTCQDYLKANGLSSNTTVITPYTSADKIALGCGAAVCVILFCAWLSLRWLHSRCGRSDRIMVCGKLEIRFQHIIHN